MYILSWFPLKFKKYKDWSIKFKLLIISTLLILCSVFFVSLFSYIQYTKDFEEQSAGRIQQIIEQVSLNIDAYIDDLFRLSISPYFNKAVMAALEDSTNSSEMEQLNRIRLIEGFLDDMMITPRKDIIRVFVITDTIYSGSRIQTSIDESIDFHNFGWYKEALKAHIPIFVPVQMEQLVKAPKFKVFSVVNQIRSTRNTDRVLGVIKVDANYAGIQAICSKVNMGNEGNLYIIDGNKNIIYTSANDKDNPDMKYIDLYEKIQHTQKTHFTTYIGKKPFLINFTKIGRPNWTVVAVNSINELNKKASYTRNIAFFMAFVCSFFAILVLIIFIKRFLNPLLAIVKLMKEVQHGNLSVIFCGAGNDEIGYLGSSFNTMVSKISEMIEQNTNLIKEVYEAKFLQKEAQINALYSQIRPHFIYNTLNMISLMVQCGKYEKAVDIINKLSSILRTMANQDKDTTLKSEIDLLNSYLSIQSSRYDGRLEYSIDIDKSLFSYTIPSLIFQPIVENSVIHGCEIKKDKTFIRIYNTEEDGCIVFNIYDNGKGMEPEVLKNLQENIDKMENTSTENAKFSGSKSGIGLINVNKRIKIRFGQKYGLKISSIAGIGTCVKIVLPKHPCKGGNINV